MTDDHDHRVLPVQFVLTLLLSQTGSRGKFLLKICIYRWSWFSLFWKSITSDFLLAFYFSNHGALQLHSSHFEGGDLTYRFLFSQQSLTSQHLNLQ